MIKLGLIGKGISHSRSQEMYEKLLGHGVDYSLLDFATEEILPRPSELFADGFAGISITFPYKQSYLPIIKVNDPKVLKIGAVNCLRFVDGVVEGTNTDYLAARDLLQEFDFKKKAFAILGDGNMALIFEELLKEAKAHYKKFFRKRDGDLNKVNYRDVFVGQGRELVVINCCSRNFIFNSELPSGTLFWDMNYSLEAHKSIENGTVIYREGLKLLELQAKFALHFWKIKSL